MTSNSQLLVLTIRYSRSNHTLKVERFEAKPTSTAYNLKNEVNFGEIKNVVIYLFEMKASVLSFDDFLCIGKKTT